MTPVERTDIFRLLYAEGLKPAHTGKPLNGSPSSISREIAKGTGWGSYNPFTAEPRHPESRKNQYPALKMTGEARNPVKPEPELRRPPGRLPGVSNLINK
jgi:IS30 family transposase